MRFAIVVDGRVVNCVEADEPLAEGWVASEVARIGDAYDGGQFIAPQPPPAPVPESVSMRQARLALLGAGLLDTVEAGVRQMSRGAQIEWEFATEVQRNASLTLAMQSALGLDDSAIDALFVEAAAL